MKLLCLLFILSIPVCCFGQHSQDISTKKSIIDYNTPSNWNVISDYKISFDGKFAIYITNNSDGTKSQLSVKGINSTWKIEVSNIDRFSVKLSETDDIVFFKKGNDSLGVIKLGYEVIKYITGISNYKIPEYFSEYVAYQQKVSGNKLFILNIKNNHEQIIDSVSYYTFNNSGKTLIANQETYAKPATATIVHWIDIDKSGDRIINRASWAGNFVFSTQGTQLVFFTCLKPDGKGPYSIYYYNDPMKEAISLVDDESESIPKGLTIANGYNSFSKDGKKLFFNLTYPQVERKNKIKSLAELDLWSYNDRFLQSQQLSPTFRDPIQKTNFKAVINISNKEIHLLEDKELQVVLGESNNKVVLGRTATPQDNYYNNSNRPTFYLIPLNGQNKKVIKKNLFGSELFISPGERFIVWFDNDSLAYYSYNVATNITKNISHSIRQPMYDIDALKIGRRKNWGICGWLDNGKELLLYDADDIWKIDLAGIKLPINLTHGFGRLHNISLGAAESENPTKILTFGSASRIILTAFDKKSKNSGFYSIRTDKCADPELLTMDSNSYYIPMSNSSVPRVGRSGYVEYASSSKPIKSSKSSYWIVSRMNAKESPNLFITTDFQHFTQLTDIHPERQYNWLSTELINWKLDDGNISQGILYKPENFDATKKYPVIFTYYEKRSDELNKFLIPSLSIDRLDIPTFVSNDYLVFVPDINFTQGHNGQSVVNSVVSSAKYLGKLPYVDSLKMGLQGHSFGGWETNYIITHSNLFAAACEASGVSDQVSGYGELLGFTSSRQRLYEVDSQGSPYGVGVTPWTNPELYIENSPIFFINGINTPLLMMHGDKDPSVPFEQAIEMFLALKRAGKKAWLLQYNNASHHLTGENAKDYSIRMQQFFDHYLKDAPAPKWMVNGIPANMKGIDYGLELEPKP